MASIVFASGMPYVPACHSSSRTIVVRAQLASDTDRSGGAARDAQDLRARLLDRRRPVDAEHRARMFLRGEAGDHPRLRRAGHRADDDRVEEDAELTLLFRDLVRPPREAETAERMVGGAGRDRVWPPAALLDGGERVLPARPDPDVEAGRVEPYVGAHDPREQDVPDAVVDDVRPVDPVLLHEHAGKPESRGDGRDLARVVRLHAADRDERVAASRDRFRGEVLELSHLVAAVREPGVAVLALRPELDLAAEVRLEPLEAVHGRRAEEQRHAVEVGDAHAG